MAFSEQEISEFKVEAEELLDTAEKALLSLDHSDYRSAFDAIFRSFHNLKGGAGMMEFMELQGHTHELETILMRFKDLDTIPHHYVSFFFRGIDAARSILNGQTVKFNYVVEEVTTPIVLEETLPELKHELQSSAIDEFLSECDEVIDNVSQKLRLIEKGEYDKDLVDTLYRDVHSLKGSAYLFSYKKLGDIAHAMESSLEKVRLGTHRPSALLLNCLFKSLEVVEALVLKIKRKETADGYAKLVPVINRALTSASEKLEEIIIPKIDVIPSAPAPQRDKEHEAASSIRVPVTLLDSLMTLMGEMVLVRNQVLQYSNKTDDLEFLSMSKRLNVVTSEIQEEMMKTRMQPIGNILEKFNRVVRDLSHDLKKNIQLVIHGAETELDKTLLEAIKDPLTHIVRNSCDHGIEAPEMRQMVGKPANGTITIRSYHEGGQVIVEITDDGKGLHKEQIINKAIEKGLISSVQAGQLSEKEVFELIFAPGFSTAGVITNVSGRGVGMDVVRTNIEKIGGTIELSGKEGQGTAIKLKIPLTLAIVPALIVKCGSGTFAIPQVKLEELVRVDQHNEENRVEYLHGSPMYRLRGNILPLVEMNKILGVNDVSSKVGEENILNIAVLNAESFSFGVIIDEIQDTADIVVKPLSRPLKSLQIYSGATILGDGSVALIFDVMGISKVAQLDQHKAKVKVEEKEELSEVQEFLIFKLNAQSNHALALNYVQRLEEFAAHSVEYSGDQRVIRYRDIILPLISLNEQLGYATTEERETLPVIVIERGGNFFGLEVNAIVDTLSTTLTVKDPPKKHRGIFGNINSDKELIVVIDPFDLIAKAMGEEEQHITSLPETYSSSTAGKVLLVEDTVFFRRAIKSILEKRGHEIIEARDGKEAIELLNKHGKSISLIVSDIEMPRMNGFQMATAIRKNPTFAELPMLAISSRADKNYRQQGMSAGFDMYLEKLKPEVLLAAVAELERKLRKTA